METNFCLYMYGFNRQMFSGVLTNLSFNPQFLGKNAKIDFFDEKIVQSVVFIKFKSRW